MAKATKPKSSARPATATSDWRTDRLEQARAIILSADPAITETLKWRGVPVFELDGILCTGETYKAAVKLTFAKGASLPDPRGLFNASLEGNTRRAIDLHEGDTINAAALKALIKAAVAANRTALAARKKPVSSAALKSPASRAKAKPTKKPGRA